jgi:hypothetical protein
MSTEAVAITSEYRDLRIAQLEESSTNPRRRFDARSLEELADYVPEHIICFLCH